MILEAMKMENEIMCTLRRHRRLRQSVAKGAAVESGTLLCVIRLTPEGRIWKQLLNFLTSTGFYQFFQGDNWKCAHYAGALPVSCCFWAL